VNLIDCAADILDAAFKDDALISLQSLSGSFPAGTQQARLAYAESLSIVCYLIEKHGWENMNDLLRTFQEGSTEDKALLKVFGVDTSGLFDEWSLYVRDA